MRANFGEHFKQKIFGAMQRYPLLGWDIEKNAENIK